jgi:hypothetical protein
MEEKLGLNNKTNMLQAALRAADYTQKQHIETTKYILKSLLEIVSYLRLGLHVEASSWSKRGC